MKRWQVKLEDGSKQIIVASDLAAALQVWHQVLIGGKLTDVVSVKRVSDE